jgi:hypothetical protein
MKLKTLFIIAASYLSLAAIGFIFIPQVFGIGAVPANPSPALLEYLRVFGSPLLGIAVLDWAARNEKASTARNAIMLGNIVGFTIIAALDIWGLFHGARPAARIFVVIHSLFAIAFIVAAKRNWSTR